MIRLIPCTGQSYVAADHVVAITFEEWNQSPGTWTVFLTTPDGTEHHAAQPAVGEDDERAKSHWLAWHGFDNAVRWQRNIIPSRDRWGQSTEDILERP